MTKRHCGIVLATVVLTVNLTAMAGYIEAVNSLSPVATWRLGESAGTTAHEEGGGVPGTYHGTALGLEGAIVGDPDTAVGFPKHSYVEIPHSSDFLLGNGTVALWFKDTGSIRTAGLFSKDSSGFDTGGHLTISTSTKGVRVRLQSTGKSYHVQSGRTGLDRWHMVGFTFGDEGMKLYLDGELADTDPYTGGLGVTSGGIGNYEPIALGAATWTSGNRTVRSLKDHYSGLIDEVSLFGTALSGCEIDTLYRSGTGEIPEPTTLAIIAAGGLGVLLRRRRRARA